MELDRSWNRIQASFDVQARGTSAWACAHAACKNGLVISPEKNGKSKTVLVRLPYIYTLGH